MIKIFNILIITNDKITRSLFVELFKRKSGISATFSCETSQTLRILREKSDYHLIFVDSNLKNSNALALISYIRGIPAYLFCPIIFISEFLDHIITVFKSFHCYDYFVKPLNPRELFQAISRILAHSSNYDSFNNDRKSIIFRFRSKSLKIFVNDIYFIETSRQKCLIHTNSERDNIYEISLSFNKVLELASEFDIVQVHRSFAVNINNISYINKSSQPWEIRFYNYEKTALVSRKYKDIITQLFEKH